jgi:hypothetical protein
MTVDTTYKIPLSEKLCVLVERTLDKFLIIPAFQRYVNRKANNKYGSIIITHGGTSEIDDVFKDYHFTDIQKSDIVLDIGAHVGGFSLFVSKFVKQVYAVEPMLHEKLVENIRINNIKNISVLTSALGEGEQTIKWMEFEDKKVKCESLKYFKDICGHIDFLKCDCEGGEWCIKADEIRDIRRIEAEVHNFDGTHKLEDFLKILDEANFEYEYTCPRQGILIIHARNKTF